MNALLIRIVLPALCVVAASTGPVSAQEHRSATPTAVVMDGSTPRSAMVAYLTACRRGDYATAARFLDLRSFPPAQRELAGPGLARQLKIVLDRKLWVDVPSLSDDSEGDREDGLPPGLDRVGVIETASGPVEILLERVRDRRGKRIWKISGTTVRKIPQLYDEFGYGPLEEVLPEVFFDIRFLEMQLWQWLAVLALLVASWLLSWFLARLLLRMVKPLVARSRTKVDDRLLDMAAAPLRLLIAAGLFRLGLLPIGLSVPVEAFFERFLRGLAIVGFAWLAARVGDVLSVWLEERLARRGQAAAIAFLPLGRRTVKVFIWMVGAIALLQNLGFNVTGIVAGLGVGGLAVALAAQKTIEHLFGGIMLIADQPVRVGDFCRFGDKIGTVEDIGLRSTRVRTLDRTVVSIPNAEFASMQLENFTRRDRIWLHFTIGLRYETSPDQMRWVLVELKKMLLAHPKVHPDPARARFSGFGAYSLDIEVFAYVLTTDYNEFVAVREDIFLRVMDIVAASGTSFAFPSQTAYLGRDEGLDEARTRAAEAQVRAWREQNRLFLPDFPPEEAATIDDSLDYPPIGSPARRSG